MKQVTAPITSNGEIMPGVYLIRLDNANQIASDAKPGQFVMVGCGEEALLRRPFSIHQASGTGELAILFRVVGRGTRWLSQRKAGESLDLLGPLGNSYSISPESHNLLLAAGGIGIAPLLFLAQQAVSQGRQVTLLLGAAIASQLYPRQLLPAGIDLVTATEDGSEGRQGMITDLLPEFAAQADQIFACGPLPMYRSMAARCLPFLKSKPVQVSMEIRMGCGLGICYSCTVKTQNGLKQVCRDGPIFDLSELVDASWQALVL